MKLKHLKRFLDSFDDEETEVFIKLKLHYDPGKLIPFSEGKIAHLQEEFRCSRLDFDSINLVLSDCYPLMPED